ncbi:MAG: PLP-dependent cysteine synthase family protein, partial [Chloroflexota bacterium]
LTPWPPSRRGKGERWGSRSAELVPLPTGNGRWGAVSAKSGRPFLTREGDAGRREPSGTIVAGVPPSRVGKGVRSEFVSTVSTRTVVDSVLGAIGSTPLVALDRLEEGLPGRVVAKLEYYSPGGSVKDRVALAVVEAAEASGELRPGGTVVELTSGNMGTGLAVVCAVKGYRMIAVMSAGNSIERRRMLEALGAKVELVPQAGGPRPGQVSKEDLELVERRTQELAQELRAFRPNQFHNPQAAAAHERTTGREIWEQSGGRVGAFVASIGTGGTFVGVAQALKARNPQVRCYAAEPATAPFIAGGPAAVTNTSHKIQGTGYALVPPLWQPELVDGYLTVTDDAAVGTARLLATREGIFGGFSGGANVAAALEVARTCPPGTLVATVICDTGLKYLSTDLYPE